MDQRQQERKKVVFRRIGGRIVPITVGAGGIAGAGVAADALRTKRVYDRKGLTIDRKLFAFQPFQVDPKYPLQSIKDTFSGDKVVLRKNGEYLGVAKYTVDKTKEGSFSWLTIRKAHREKGYSQILAKQAAIEMHKKGARTIRNHVVHKGSISTGWDPKRDTLWKHHLPRKRKKLRTILAELKNNPTSAGARKAYRELTRNEQDFISKVNRKEAGRLATRWQNDFRRTPSWYNIFDWSKGSKVRVTNVDRVTRLPKFIRRPIKPFRTTANKLSIGLGLAAAVGSAGYLALRDRD